MSDAEIDPAKEGGAWVRLPNGDWVLNGSPEHIDYWESLGRKKEESDSGHSPGVLSPEIGSADRAAAELAETAAKVSEQKFRKLTSPEEKRKRQISQFLRELKESGKE